MKKQQGAAALLVVSVLLVAALMMSLGSYKSLFYQIKRANNQIEARQEHWRAEGGLECVFALVQETGAVPTPVQLDACNTSLTLTKANQYLTVVSESGFAEITKVIKIAGRSGAGAIQTTADLYLNGSNSISPDPLKEASTPNKWQCRAVTYSNKLQVFGNLQNKGLTDGAKPYIDFPSGQGCDSGHQSTVTSSPTHSQQDFRLDVSQQPFENFFAEKREDWFKVMSNEEFVKVSATSLTKNSGEMKFTQQSLPAPSRVDDCGTQIKNIIDSGKDLIWIYGNCHLTGTDLSNIGTAINTHTPSGVILVAHNGLFTTSGALTFKGLLFHFVSGKTDNSGNFLPDFVPSSASWTSSSSTVQDDLNALKLVFNGHVANFSPKPTDTDIVYYQQGAFFPSGGYVMDAPGQAAIFGAALDLYFDGNAIDVPLSRILKTTWKKGSWNDL
ncbi:TPA: hypothetical protein ACMDSI_003866 [Vibrio parahaemolyticus]